MIRRLYDWVIRLAQHKNAIPAMGAVSFMESSFFPIPPDVMLVPMVLANREKITSELKRYYTGVLLDLEARDEQ